MLVTILVLSASYVWIMEYVYKVLKFIIKSWICIAQRHWKLLMHSWLLLFILLNKIIISWLLCIKQISSVIFKPPPPVGSGGGYMFSGCPSVRASVRASILDSRGTRVVLCFRNISSICWRIFAKPLSLVHLGTEMNWLDFGVKRSKFKVTPSRRRRTALDATVECNSF